MPTLWPQWTDDEPWLAELLEEAAAIAQKFGQHAVDNMHLDVAYTSRDDGSVLMMRAGLDPSAHRDYSIFTLGMNAGGDQVEFGRRPSMGTPPEYVHSDLLEVLEYVRDERDRTQRSVGPEHVLVALTRYAPVGHLTLQKARELVGFRHERVVLAQAIDRAMTYRPSGRTPMLLMGGGGTNVRHIELISLACRMTSRPLIDTRLAVVWIETPDTSRQWDEANTFTQVGARYIDAQLRTREDAMRTEVVERLRSADVIFIPGGHPEPKFAALVGTPALEAIAKASDEGAIIAGSSAGSVLMGTSTPSRMESGDEIEDFPMLGWLQDIRVAPHYWPRTNPAPAPTSLRSATSARVLYIADGGAVIAEPGWTSFSTAATWKTNFSAIAAPDDQSLEPLSDSQLCLTEDDGPM